MEWIGMEQTREGKEQNGMDQGKEGKGKKQAEQISGLIYSKLYFTVTSGQKMWEKH